MRNAPLLLTACSILTFVIPTAAQVELVAVQPASGQYVATSAPEIVITFTGLLDTATITNDSVRLYRIGDNLLTPGPDDTLISTVNTALDPPTAIRINAAQPLADGRYAIVVYGTETDRSGPGYGLDFYRHVARYDPAPFKALAEEFTLEAWTRWDRLPTDGGNSWGAIFDVGQSGRYIPGFWLSHHGPHLAFGFRRGDGTTGAIKHENVFEVGVWRHIAGVSSPEGLTLYADGEFLTTIPDSFRPIDIADSIELAICGYSRWAGAYDYIDAFIDELRVWNVARTQQQIRAAMHVPLAGNEPGLVLYHPLDDPSSNVMIDATGGGHDGTTGGAARLPSEAPLIEMASIALRASDESGIDMDLDGVPGGVLLSPFSVDTTAPRVTGVDPDLTGCTTLVELTKLVLSFDDVMDEASLTPDNVSLVGSGGDGTFGDGNEVDIPMVTGLFDSEARTVTMSPETPPLDDAYRLTLSGNVRNAAGLILDGEYPGDGGPDVPLPSGDGIAGGEFILQFNLDRSDDCNDSDIADICELVPGTERVIAHTFRAYIDGHDQLRIKRDTVRWHHFSGAAAPGRHNWGSGDEPTYIDGKPWIPDWPDPPPSEIRYETDSSIFVGLDPRLPAMEVDVDLRIVAARDSVSISELPTGENGFVLVIDINDPSSGPDWYEFEITLFFIPTSDCNENDVLDECDLRSGFSTDCDDNGVPDECEILADDCNGDDVLDRCGSDCNNDGVADVCELLAGATDCNDNGLPDECEIHEPRSSLVFDGADDLARIPHHPSLGFEQDDEFTIEVWVGGVTGISGSTASILEKWDEHGPYPFVLRLNAMGQVSLGSYRGSGSAADVLSSSSVFDGAWHHVAGVRKGREWMRLYLDGKLEDEETDIPVGSIANSQQITLGARGNAVRFFDGTLDELRVWNTARDQAAIIQDMGRPLVGNEDHLVGYWRLDEGAGQLLADSSPNGNNGYLGANSNEGGDSRDPAWVASDSPVLGGDCNDNGILDECDIADQTSDDCNENGHPDECESADDCNGNSIQDICDLAAGTSLDCNGDAVPDDCQLIDNDCDDNGVPDECEDCNDNGLADACDLDGGTSDDCDANGVPDECEPDCNGNGTTDACDLRDGTSPDFDQNGVPDECQPDCNGNGFPDFIDIAFAFSADCNRNTVPDECDLSARTSGDCNGNTVPDECDIAAEDSFDCDDDRTPDECEPDSDGDGWPDDCDGPGDFDHDADVDLDDYGIFDLCLYVSGPGEDNPFVDCREVFDADDDDDIDLIDFAAMQRGFAAGG